MLTAPLSPRISPDRTAAANVLQQLVTSAPVGHCTGEAGRRWRSSARKAHDTFFFGASASTASWYRLNLYRCSSESSAAIPVEQCSAPSLPPAHNGHAQGSPHEPIAATPKSHFRACGRKIDLGRCLNGLSPHKAWRSLSCDKPAPSSVSRTGLRSWLMVAVKRVRQCRHEREGLRSNFGPSFFTWSSPHRSACCTSRSSRRCIGTTGTATGQEPAAEHRSRRSRRGPSPVTARTDGNL